MLAATPDASPGPFYQYYSQDCIIPLCILSHSSDFYDPGPQLPAAIGLFGLAAHRSLRSLDCGRQSRIRGWAFLPLLKAAAGCPIHCCGMCL